MCLSRLFAPLAAVFVAFGLAFSILAHPAEAEPASAGPAPAASTFAELKSVLDATDRLAVLEAIHVGLSEAADGATYMWHRHNGKIAGSVRPTMSFRDAEGKICRYLVFQVLLGEHMRQVEGIACRQSDKSWLLEG